MKDLSLTVSEKFLLREVDSCPDKIVQRSILRISARHLTNRGFSIVVNRMLDRNLFGRDGDKITITFSGLQALRAS